MNDSLPGMWEASDLSDGEADTASKLQELIESRREFPVSALIKLWIKTHKKPTAQRLGHEYHVLEYLAQWLQPLDTAGILETPLPWYVDRGVMKAAAGKIGIKPEQLYTVLLCMEY